MHFIWPRNPRACRSTWKKNTHTHPVCERWWLLLLSVKRKVRKCDDNVRISYFIRAKVPDGWDDRMAELGPPRIFKMFNGNEARAGFTAERTDTARYILRWVEMHCPTGNVASQHLRINDACIAQKLVRTRSTVCRREWRQHAKEFRHIQNYVNRFLSACTTGGYVCVCVWVFAWNHEPTLSAHTHIRVSRSFAFLVSKYY